MNEIQPQVQPAQYIVPPMAPVTVPDLLPATDSAEVTPALQPQPGRFARYPK